jgi:hypothetical protein
MCVLSVCDVGLAITPACMRSWRELTYVLCSVQLLLLAFVHVRVGCCPVSAGLAAAHQAAIPHCLSLLSACPCAEWGAGPAAYDNRYRKAWPAATKVITAAVDDAKRRRYRGGFFLPTGTCGRKPLVDLPAPLAILDFAWPQLQVGCVAGVVAGHTTACCVLGSLSVCKQGGSKATAARCCPVWQTVCKPLVTRLLPAGPAARTADCEVRQVQGLHAPIAAQALHEPDAARRARPPFRRS